MTKNLLDQPHDQRNPEHPPVRNLIDVVFGREDNGCLARSGSGRWSSSPPCTGPHPRAASSTRPSASPRCRRHRLALGWTGGQEGQVGVGDHGQGDVPVPGGVLADRGNLTGRLAKHR